MGLDGYFRFLFALTAVIVLIGLAAWAAKRLIPSLRAVNQGGVRRIGIVEVTTLDTRRRLVLLRRDDVEHLVILGPNSETVVERGIRRGFDAALASAARAGNDETPDEARP